MENVRGCKGVILVSMTGTCDHLWAPWQRTPYWFDPSPSILDEMRSFDLRFHPSSCASRIRWMSSRLKSERSMSQYSRAKTLKMLAKLSLPRPIRLKHWAQLSIRFVWILLFNFISTCPSELESNGYTRSGRRLLVSSDFISTRLVVPPPFSLLRQRCTYSGHRMER